MKIKYSLFLFLILFSSCVVSAEVQTLGRYSKGDTVFLTQVCDNCTYINITRIEYPRSPPEVFIDTQMNEMVAGNFNYSFSNTNEFGDYIVTTCGDPNGIYTCASYNFTIGNIAFIYVLLIGGIILLGLGAILKIPLLGLASGVLLSVSGIYFIILISDVYTQAVGYTSLLVGLAVGFSAASEYFTE